MDHISIVLVHFNTDKETKLCLQSLLKVAVKGCQVQVIVVDNGSKVPFELSVAAQRAGYELLRSEKNLGFCDGNTLGIQVALSKYQSDYVVLLNTDTQVDPKFLQHLYQFAQDRPKVGMVTPKIYFAPGREYFTESYQKQEHGSVLWYAGGSIDWRNIFAFHRGIDEIDRGQFDAQTSSDFATGCCVLIRREVIERIGSLDDAYFLYLEDVEWSQRAKQFGFEIGFCATSKVWHINAGSTQGAGSPIAVYYQTRNRAWFFWMYGSWRTKLTVLSWVARTLRFGSATERNAILDAVLGRMGKQHV